MQNTLLRQLNLEKGEVRLKKHLYDVIRACLNIFALPKTCLNHIMKLTCFHDYPSVQLGHHHVTNFT